MLLGMGIVVLSCQHQRETVPDLSRKSVKSVCFDGAHGKGRPKFTLAKVYTTSYFTDSKWSKNIIEIGKLHLIITDI